MTEEELKKLQEKTATLFEELKKRNDQKIEEAEKRGGIATAETTNAVEKINVDIEELRKSWNEFEKRMNRPVLDQINKTNDGVEITEEMRQYESGFIKRVRNGHDAELTPEETRALAGTSDADGGIFIPPTFEGGVIMNAYDQAELRPICDVGPTGRDSITFPSLSKPAVSWGRKAAAVSTADLSSGGKKVEVFFLTALTTIAIDTLDDAEADIVSEMTSGYGLAIAEAEDDAIAVGAGDNTPSGIASDATVQANYSATGVADNIFDGSHNGTDAMIAAQYKIKKTYRRNAHWGFNSQTESAVRTLKDGQGRYLWQPSLQVGKPPTFDGYGIVNPEGMADIAAGAIAMIFGDFKQYRLRDRKGLTVQRLVEKYAEYAQIGFLIRKRVAGGLVLPEAFSCVKVAAS